MCSLLVVTFLLCAALSTCQCDVKIQLIGADSLDLNFTLSNPLSIPQKVLKWGTPFEGIWTDMFDIRDEQNNRVDYIGMLVRRGEAPIEEEYVIIPAGGSISAIVNLADNYDFLSAGEFVVQLDLPLYSEIEYTPNFDQVVSVFLRDTPSRDPVKKPQGFTNCNANNINQINAALRGSSTESTRSYNCLNQRTCNTQYTTWFGTFSTANNNYLMSVYNNVRNRLANYEFNGYCNPAGCGSNIYGYVYPTDTTFTVYLCGLFWSLPAERVNTIVHELSHFRSLGATQDYAYGKTNCMNLARSDPARASRNADNVCYFSESV